MKIAIVGIRGLPSSYSGYEAFIAELAPRLVARGHDVLVYCRRSLFPERLATWQGIRLRYLPSIEHKAFSTLSHSLISMVHAVFTGADLVLVVNAANGFYGIIPRVAGKPCVLNVDGMEWLRPKWNKVARWIFRTSAKLGTRFYDEIVTDADEMHRLYAREFGIDSTYIAYGANIEASSRPEVLDDYGLEPDGYYLIASRLVPDNNADIIVQGFLQSSSRKMLAIAGGADYAGNTVERKFLVKLKSRANDRVKFLGHISAPGHIKELHCNCFAYVHGHQFGGINPSLLKALGYGNCVLALATPFNAEVLEDGRYGLLFEKNSASVADHMRAIEADPEIAQRFRLAAPERIRERFTWEKITDEYEELFEQLAGLRGTTKPTREAPPREMAVSGAGSTQQGD
jgi:glycosyltransferase involved in cell wall biosynthesis